MKTDNFIKKIVLIKESTKLDISAWQDLSIAIMNLVSLEEHAFFSYAKTNDEKFLKILENTRKLRTKLLALIVKKDDDSEKWCMSKHFLAASMRLYETANRFLGENKKQEAKGLYKDAAELYACFIMLNSPEKTKIEISNKEKKGIFSSIKELLKCCDEW